MTTKKTPPRDDTISAVILTKDDLPHGTKTADASTFVGKPMLDRPGGKKVGEIVEAQWVKERLVARVRVDDAPLLDDLRCGEPTPDFT